MVLVQTRSPGGASEAKQDDILAALASILTELNAKLEAGESIELGAVTLAALESIQATVSGSVAITNLPGTQTVAGTVNVGNLPATQPVSGTVDLSAATLSALETINAVISAPVALDAASLAALEAITATISGTVSISGTVGVNNFPASYPLPSAQVTALTPPTTIALDAPTLAALEAIQAAVTGTVALDGPTLAALESITAAVTGTVALDASTLAALEAITVSGQVSLDSTTLAALETINAVCSGTVELGATSLAALESITATVSGAIALDSATLAALENITVSGTVALDAPTLAALETISAVVSGTVDLPPATIAALQNVTAAVSGTVAISNLPASYPLPAGQLATLTPQTNALTDAQLRASQVDIADSGEREYPHAVATVTNVGDTTIVTPAAGKAIRLRYIYCIGDPTTSVPPLINVKLGNQVIYRHWGLAKRQRKTGPVDGALIINLSDPGKVAVTAIYEEV